MTGQPAGRAAEAQQMAPINSRRKTVINNLIRRRTDELLEQAARQHFDGRAVRYLDENVTIQWRNIRRDIQNRARREVLNRYNLGNPR